MAVSEPGVGLTIFRIEFEGALEHRSRGRQFRFGEIVLPKRGGLGQILRGRVVCDEERSGVWPSDHFGVYAELRSELA